MSVPENLRRMAASLAAGRVPSLADHYAAGTADALAEGSPVEPDPQPVAEPTTSRPQPPPEPEQPIVEPVVEPVAPEQQPLEEMLVNRAMLMNPGLRTAQARRVARKALAYVRSDR